MQPVLQVKNISKAFSGVQALTDISIDFYPGQVHVLVGENGAGKSTLIKIISGVYRLDQGEMLLDGKPFTAQTPREGINAGISVIHQELSVIPDLTVAENIYLGDEPRLINRCFLDKKQLFSQVEAQLQALNIPIRAKDMVRNLSTAMQQIVEILRAVNRNAKVVIMDEPTSSLSASEVETLFALIETLRQRNIVVIYISHRMDEIFRIGKSASILKDGRLVGTVQLEDTNQDGLISLMVGRKIQDYFIKSRKPAEHEAVLEVRHLSRKGAFEDVSFSLYRGEVLGFSGLVGAGRTEVMRAIFGADPPDEGEVILGGAAQSFRHPARAISKGIGLVPEDRRTQGILLDKNVSQNISLVNLFSHSFHGIINLKKETMTANEYVEKLRVKTPSIKTLTRYLSGGNQQKVVLGKWLSTDTNILILDEPTRGIDVSAKAEIYALIKEFVESLGGSVILVSSELPEIIGVCHRTVVMREGRLQAILSEEEINETTIMQYATLAANQ